MISCFDKCEWRVRIRKALFFIMNLFTPYQSRRRMVAFSDSGTWHNYEVGTFWISTSNWPPSFFVRIVLDYPFLMPTRFQVIPPFLGLVIRSRLRSPFHLNHIYNHRIAGALSKSFNRSELSFYILPQSILEGLISKSQAFYFHIM